MNKIFIKNKFTEDKRGYFGEFGGKFIPELLYPAISELEAAYDLIKTDIAFEKTLFDLYKNYSGRPTPLYFAENLSKKLDCARIFLKNEGLNHTGAHKMNHCLGQALLAKRMGKKRLIAETGAGQHGLATATVAAKFGFECTVYMGEIDYNRQRPNVFWMEQLGAEVIPVKHGTKRLKDAVTAALQDWIKTSKNTYYLLGTAAGPHPFPAIVRDFQSIIGIETKQQLKEIYGVDKPDYVLACVGGGSNAIGIFNTFLDDEDVKLIGIEAGGKGIKKKGGHAARMTEKKIGVLEGYKSFFLQNEDGQIEPTHSISAGLDYAGVGPQHAYLNSLGRVTYEYATDTEALDAYQLLCKTEGIIAAMESSHALAYAFKLAPTLSKEKVMVVNVSGRGDKDLFITAKQFAEKSWIEFLKTQIK